VPARIDNLNDLKPTAPSTRIGDSLKQLSEETSDLPIGAVVLLSDGDDNTAALARTPSTLCAPATFPFTPWGSTRTRRARCRTRRCSDCSRALADSRIAAKITFHQRGYAAAEDQPGGARCHHRQPKVLASRAVTLGPDGNVQTETLMFDIGGAGARTLQIAAIPLAGEENTANNTLTRVVNVGSDPRRIL